MRLFVIQLEKTSSDCICHFKKFTMKIPYIYRKAGGQDVKPLNFYIMDDVVLKLFRKSCDNMSLEDALGEEDVVCAFFGTVEEAKAITCNITQEEWEAME